MMSYFRTSRINNSHYYADSTVYLIFMPKFRKKLEQEINKLGMNLKGKELIMLTNDYNSYCIY